MFHSNFTRPRLNYSRGNRKRLVVSGETSKWLGNNYNSQDNWRRTKISNSVGLTVQRKNSVSEELMIVRLCLCCDGISAFSTRNADIFRGSAEKSPREWNGKRASEEFSWASSGEELLSGSVPSHIPSRDLNYNRRIPPSRPAGSRLVNHPPFLCNFMLNFRHRMPNTPSNLSVHQPFFPRNLSPFFSSVFHVLRPSCSFSNGNANIPAE